MSNLNATPAGERVHIGLFGCRNAGKSSLINALTGQSLAVVSDVPGTTTDPVAKAMELFPLGPVLFIDTGGLDDSGALGEMRVQKARQILNKTDVALVVIDSTQGIRAEDEELLLRIREKGVSCLIVFTKSELAEAPGLPAFPSYRSQRSNRSKHRKVKKSAGTATAPTGITISPLRRFIAAGPDGHPGHTHRQRGAQRTADPAPATDDTRNYRRRGLRTGYPGRRLTAYAG